MKTPIGKRGGARAGAGLAKDVGGEKVKNISISVDIKTIEILRKFGNNNLSRGVRMAARLLVDTHEKTSEN